MGFVDLIMGVVTKDNIDVVKKTPILNFFIVENNRGDKKNHSESI